MIFFLVCSVGFPVLLYSLSFFFVFFCVFFRLLGSFQCTCWILTCNVNFFFVRFFLCAFVRVRLLSLFGSVLKTETGFPRKFLLCVKPKKKKKIIIKIK